MSELREGAVRLVLEACEEQPEPSLNAAVLWIGPRVGVNKDTVLAFGRPHPLQSLPDSSRMLKAPVGAVG
jgi:hypothetical protein